jgi:hypothetical protein
MSVDQSRKRAKPLIYLHCSRKIEASQPNLGSAAKAMRETAKMICPFCGKEFFLTLKPVDVKASRSQQS